MNEQHDKSIEEGIKKLIEESPEFLALKEELEKSRRDADRLRVSLHDLMNLVDTGVLVRDISRDSDPGWALKAIRWVKILSDAKRALDETQ